ncbi:hypothetical protein PFDSM3638_03290 [Pyrococcus furiosus DSM 3638]|nr:hypothetical protein PFC_02445 [Pyrococcus furiosus COM1]QEK78358.1 hypothetical protein PFDSM3638_03290 [Pyrococcus furiosus DSM 3638]
MIPPIVLVLFAIAQSTFEKDFPEDAYYLGGLLTVVSGSIGRYVFSMHYGKDGKVGKYYLDWWPAFYALSPYLSN